MNKLVQISFVFSGVPKILDLEPVFSDMGDWVRYSNTNWLLWTEFDVERLFLTVSPHLDEQDMYVSTFVEDNAIGGRLPSWVWEWLEEKMPGSFLDAPPSGHLPKSLPGPKSKP